VVFAAGGARSTLYTPPTQANSPPDHGVPLAFTGTIQQRKRYRLRH
jgi:hypothetical protein